MVPLFFRAAPELGRHVWFALQLKTLRFAFVLLFVYYSRYTLAVTHDEGKAITKITFFYCTKKDIQRREKKSIFTS